MPTKLFAFILMPFDSSFDDIYKLGIKKTMEASGFVTERVDDQIYLEDMLERIKNQIELADIIVADMTGKNPNVFYEVGYAHAKSKICILLTSKSEDIPFDLKHKPHIVYGNSISELSSKLKVYAKQYRKVINDTQKSISIELSRVSGFLSNSKYESEASIEIVFDLFNKTGERSPEISAIYFYTGSGWTYLDQQKSCVSTNSDVPQYEVRHLIDHPVRRLEKKIGWAQIKLLGSKTIAHALRGEKLPTTHRIAGKSMLRLITGDKTQDFYFNLDIDISENIL